MTKTLTALALTFTLVLGGFGGAPGLGGRVALAQGEPPPATNPSPTTTTAAGTTTAPPVVPPDTRPKKPLSLQEAIQAALANNMTIAIRKLDPEYARQGVIQFEAAFDPLLSSNASYSESKSEPQSSFQASSSKVISADVGVSQTLKEGFSYDATWRSFRAEEPSLINPISPYYNSTLSLSVRQPILRGFGQVYVTTQLEISKLDVATSQSVFQSTVITTLEAAVDAYWDLNSAIENYANSVQSLGLAQDLLGQNQKKVEVGTLAPIQITEARASVASRQQDVILTSAAIRNAEDNLRRIMNIPPDSPEWDMALVPTDKPVVSGDTPDLQRSIDQAIANRPEIAQAKVDLRVRELNNRYAEAFRKPQLDLIASYAPSGNNYEFRDTNGDNTVDLVLDGWSDSATEVFKNHNYDWSVGANFSIPLRNRNARAGAARSKISLEQGQLTLENLQRDIQVETRVAVRSVITLRNAVDAARENVRLQEEKLEAEQKRYDNGMSTSFQVLSFQTDLTAARAQLIVALAAYNKSIAALGRVTATLPGNVGVTIAQP